MSGGRETSSLWNSQAAEGIDGWGDAAASGSGWGSKNVGTSDGWPSDPAASGENMSISQWDTETVGWGTSRIEWGSFDNSGWGSTGTDPGGNWGQGSKPEKDDAEHTETGVLNVGTPVSPEALQVDMAAIAMVSLSQAIPPAFLSSEPNQIHGEGHDTDIQTPTVIAPLPLECSTRPGQSAIAELINSKMSQLILSTALILKRRGLDAESTQWSALRKSRQLVMTRAARNLFHDKFQEFTDTWSPVGAELRACYQQLARSGSIGLPIVQLTLATPTQDHGQFEQLKGWVSRAEGCLSLVQVKRDSISPMNKSARATFFSRLKQLKERTDSLAGTYWLWQSPEFYNSLLDHQLQEKRDMIVAALVKGQDATFNHFLSTSFIFQRKAEIWDQMLQKQKEEIAQALLQTKQLDKDGKTRSLLKAKERDTIQELQVSVAQKKSQLQVLQEEMTKLKHTLTSIRQQEQTFINDTLGVHIPYIEACIQKHIQVKAIPNIEIASSKLVKEFGNMESQTIEMVWKALQSSMQMAIWLQHSDIYNTEEEMEMKEIEESLIG
ncbi:hypothetical protein B0F90DRAFT_1685989 [Multifurca ochricompacta]|uniref:Uncharacterized protein n=1 Tax=Multifurca ochricompacta TaxID=376703 RepID=A0AAD4QR03_9AGAM|nr:hypothetical protein B0F90DRAFT_1685989 [Multifurca ochricompacta]